MITFGQVCQQVSQDIHETTSDDIENIKSKAVMVQYELVPKAPWEAMRQEYFADFSLSDPTYHTMLMPADLCNVEGVFETSAQGASQYYGREYLPGSRFGNAQRPTYAFTRPVTSPLAVLQNVSVVSLSNTWGGGTWSPSYIGEYIRFGSSQGLYKITAQNTFDPIFFGDDIVQDVAFIRPVGTRNMILKDESGNLIKPKVTIYYWHYPPPLYLESQDILFPSSRALELAIQLRMFKKDRRDNRDLDELKLDFKDAMDEMVSQNPRFIKPQAPTNALGGSVFNMNHRTGGYHNRRW